MRFDSCLRLPLLWELVSVQLGIMTDPLFSVKDQVVLVSGGTRGIGHAIAQGFAERDARVVITGRDASASDEVAREMKRGLHAVRGLACDVGELDQIDQLVEQVNRDVGPVDVLINVAGVNRRKPALELDEEDYDFVLDVNLKGAFWLSRAVGKGMVERGKGCQINVASLNTDRPLTNVLPYAVSKAGIGTMTRALALEWGASGVRVNGIAPGFILTDLTEKLWSDPEMQAWGMANTPQKRMGKPEDMVGAALFLASPGSGFMTGQTIFVDGGFSAGWAWPIPS